jgi:hypothetical protein
MDCPVIEPGISSREGTFNRPSYGAASRSPTLGTEKHITHTTAIFCTCNINKPTKLIQGGPFREAGTYPACQETTRLLWSPKVQSFVNKANHWTLSIAISIQSTSQSTLLWDPKYHLCLDLSSVLLTSGFPAKILCKQSSLCMIHVFTLIILSEENKLHISLLFKFLRLLLLEHKFRTVPHSVSQKLYTHLKWS